MHGFINFLDSSRSLDSVRDNQTIDSLSSILRKEITVIIVYVDGIILSRDDSHEMEGVKHMMARKFEVKDLKTLKNFLGMEIARSKKVILVSQRKYTWTC